MSEGEVKEGNVKLAHDGKSNLDVYVFDISKDEKRGCYRASICDGERISTNLYFDPWLNNRVEDELCGQQGKISIIRLEMTEIVQKCVVAVQRYKKIADGPFNIGREFYKKLKPRGILTPSRMTAKFF